MDMDTKYISYHGQALPTSVGWLQPLYSDLQRYIIKIL